MNFILPEDNNLKHTSKSTMDYLKRCKLKVYKGFIYLPWFFQAFSFACLFNNVPIWSLLMLMIHLYWFLFGPHVDSSTEHLPNTGSIFGIISSCLSCHGTDHGWPWNCNSMICSNILQTLKMENLCKSIFISTQMVPAMLLHSSK